MEEKGMKIIRLEAENIKRLKAVEITPDGNIVRITGKNAQGKTSVLDALLYVMGGKDTIPKKPIRDGEKSARGKIVFDGLVIERKWTADDKTYLSVTSGDGAKYPTPQAMIDKLLGKLTFDPLEFARMEPKEQFEVLRGLVDIGIDVDALDKKRADLYDERTMVNREVKTLEANLSAAPHFDGVPDTEVNLSDLLAEQEKIRAACKRNDEARKAVSKKYETQRQAIRERKAELKNAVDAIKNEGMAAQTAHEAVASKLMERQAREAALRLELAEVEKAVDELKKTEKTAREALELKRSEYIKADGEHKSFDTDAICKPIDEAEAAELADIVDPSADEVVAKTKTAGEVNEKVRRNNERAKIQETLTAKKSEAEKLTAQMDGLDAVKTKALTSAKFPIDGLGFDFVGGEITYNGLPFSQASSAEQLRVSLAIAMALNPKLRVIRITDGSLLDSASFKLITDMAVERDFQVWIEQIAETGEVGFYIEDGSVVSVDGKPVEKKAEAAGK